jgi:neutral ceramidase
VSSPGPLLLGVGKADVTPPLGTPLAGYANPERVAERVDDPLYARVMTFQQGDLQAALVMLDWLVVQIPERARIAALVAAATGITADHILVGGIQTHSAPQTERVWGWGPLNEEYIEASLPQIVAAAQSAVADLEPVSFGAGVGQSDAAINRRGVDEQGRASLWTNPYGLYDPEVIVWRFDSAQATKAVLVNYGAHPTTRHGENRGISRDYPGVLVDAVESVTGGFAVFVNGVVGDVAPRNYFPEQTGTLEIGLLLAREAVRVLETIRCEADVPLGVLPRLLQLPYAPLLPREEAAVRLAELDPGAVWGMEAARRCYYKAVLAEWEAGQVQTARPFPQIVLRIGDAALAPFPGEHFAETGLRLKRFSPFRTTITASTMMGHEAYFTPREACARGGYEKDINMALGPYLFAERIDDFLVEENLKLLRELAAQESEGIHPRSGN